MRSVFALLFTCAVAAARAGSQPTADDIPFGTPAEALQRFLHAQTNAAEHIGQVLAMTGFGGWTNTVWRERQSGRLAHSYTVSKYVLLNSGEWYSSSAYRPFGSGAFARLSDAQLKTIISAIRELPATNATLPIEDLVLVGFHQGTNWVTYRYDARNPPEVLKQIDKIRESGWTRNFTVN